MAATRFLADPPPPQLPQMDAVLPLCKPVGPSSAQCLAVLKRQGQRKIGHAGTLDPLASGVLIVLLGQATKLSPWLMVGCRKIYRGALRLGMETDTWDTEGRIVAEKPWQHISEEAVREGIADWEALDSQEVPAFSAAKFNGQPLYKLARKGQHTPVKVKKVDIFEAAVLEIGMPYVKFRVSCGSGSYIRSLAHSLGVRLGCGAALCELTREYSHPFDLSCACPWEEALSGSWTAYTQPMAAALPSWKLAELDENDAARVRNGIAPQLGNIAERALLCHAGAPLALAERKEHVWVITRGLWNT